mgnify:FL=1|jgi:chromate transporter
MSLLELFGIFFYVGLFTIGGGQVAITLMQQVFFEKNLITPERFYNMVAISESTPGPIGINMATYIGCHFYGFWGGCITTFGTVLPSLIIIMIIASFFSKVQEKALVKAAFNGLRPAVTGLVAVAAWQVFKIALLNIDAYSLSGKFLDLFSPISIGLYVVMLVVFFKTKLHPVILVLLGAIAGIILL